MLSDVSRLRGVPAYRIAYLFAAGKLPEPRLRLGNRRVFNAPEVRSVARPLGHGAGAR
jgi:hypothetical protein